MKSYFLFNLTILIISFVTSWNRYHLKDTEHSPTLIVLLVEICKIIGMKLFATFYLKKNLKINKKRSRNYLIIGFLYLWSNILLFNIISQISAGTFMVLSQQRIFWVLMISIIMINKRYVLEEYVACIINFLGVLMIVSEKYNTAGNPIVLLLIIAHSIIGAFASVYTQKTMQITPDTLESYCEESYNLYMHGLPFYFALFLYSATKIIIPDPSIVLFTAFQGVFIGAIFKYYSAMHRTLMQSIVLFIIMIISKLFIDPEEDLNRRFYFSSCVILISVYLFVLKKIKSWMVIVLALSVVGIATYNDDPVEIKHYRFCIALHNNDHSRDISWANNIIHDTKIIKFGYNCPSCNVDHTLKGNLALDRTLEMFKYTTEHYECDQIIKLDDDVDFYSENINNIDIGTSYGGFILKNNNLRFASGGAGYVINGKIAETIAKLCKIKTDLEDVGVARCIKQIHNIQPTEIKGFNPDTPEQMINWYLKPSYDHISRFDKDADPITFHYVKGNRKHGSVIPKRIHMIWLGNIKKAPLESLEACKEINSDWEFNLWTDDKIKNHVFDSKYQKHFISTELCDNVNGHEHYLCLSDLLRLELLYLYGGIYMDVDSMCQKSLNELPLQNIELFAAYENEFTTHHANLVANGVIGSVQYNRDIYNILSNIHLLKVGEPWSTTGPCLVSQSLFNLDAKICPKNKIGYVGGNSKNPTVLSSRYFYPVHFSGFSGPGTKQEVINNAITAQQWGSSTSKNKKLRNNENFEERWKKLS
jgi:mannosyltransferase OCH1-like enzyme/drug/metabolite transporter (DMT)-like permease